MKSIWKTSKSICHEDAAGHAWEIAIKISLNKYTLPEPYEEFIEREIVINQFYILPIVPRHTAVLTRLPFHHRDPFDRLIIAQAMVEQMPVISGDAVFAAYTVTRIW
jgi:PIN domain nuclease of toxin-antitoxin system